MKLEPEQRKELRMALMSAFRLQPELGLMIEDELGKDLNQITQGQPTYDLTAQELLKWAEANGKLFDLVVGASVAKPGNPNLQKFVQTYLPILLEVESTPTSNLLPSNSLTPLIQALSSVNNFSDSVLPACTQTLPDMDLYHPKEREQLGNDELGAAVKWLILLKLFLERYNHKNSEGHLYLVLFIRNLRGQPALSSTPSERHLTQWLNSLPMELQIPEPTPELRTNQPRPPDEALRKLQAYFVITVEPPGITMPPDRFGVNGYLISRLGNDNQYTKYQAVNLPVLSDDTSESRAEEKQQQKGLFCTLEQVEYNLPDWLLQVEKAIESQCAELQTTFSLNFLPAYDLTVEFWLTFDHLTAPVDSWKVYGQPVIRKQRTLVLGKKYPVVVRSYDRFSDSRCLNDLSRTWQNLAISLQKPSEPGALRQKFEVIDCWERWAAIQQQPGDATCLGLALTCPLCLEPYREQQEALFAWMLEEGIPIALWSRAHELADLPQKMDELLTAESLRGQSDQWLDQIKKTRKQANNEQSLGHHLAIWFDEPNRLLELKEYLNRGRLRA